MKTRLSLTLWVGLLSFLPAGFVFAQAPGAAALVGRIADATTDVSLNNARVAIVGTTLVTASDEDGEYRLTGVSPGQVTLQVSYVGYDRQTVTVAVAAGGVARQDVQLVRSDRTGGRGRGEEIVRLDEFRVVVDREMSAQAVAMNEQRAAANIKNVVSLDEYGDRGQENIGEFMRFMPGVAVVDSGLTPSELSVRGVPADTTTIMLDGSNVADAAATSRNVAAQSIPMGNIARVEITKVPTPDMPANGLGGYVNVISRSGFERKRALLSYQIYQTFNTNSGITMSGGPRGQLPEVSPRSATPSFAFSYLQPLGDKLAISASISSTWRKRGLKGRDETPTWNIVDLFQRASTWSHLRSIVTTRSGQVGADWRITPRNVLTAGFQIKRGWVIVPRSQLNINFGAGATGNAQYTQGAATGVGTATMGNGSNQQTKSENSLVRLKYTHRGDQWELTASGSIGHANRRPSDMSNGHFNNVTSQITNLVIRGDGIGEDGSTIPTRFTAVDRTGAAVDVYDGGNYTINTLTTGAANYNTDQLQAQLDLKRDFRWLVVKVGAAVNAREADNRGYPVTYNFRPNGSAVAADRLAGKFDVFDEAYNAVEPAVNGKNGRWISEALLYQLYLQHPTWFVDVPATTYQNWVTNSRKMDETISAAYLRGDLKLLDNRLWLVTGVRFEDTRTEGWGALNDPSAIYRKDATGAIVRVGGQPVLLTTDPLEQARLRYRERSAHSSRSYDGFYPSFNGTFNITDDILLRAAYARTIGRPNLNYIIPGVTIPDPTTSSRTITVVNTGLKPWTADNYDLSLESYQIKNGFGSIGVFQKDIKDFFNTVTMAATPELLAQYEIPSEDVYADYLISTRTNGGDARVRGIEVMYRQRLTFLPGWARGVQVFVNYTKLKLHGDRAADFGSFTPDTLAWGVSLIRPKYSLKFTSTHQSETQRGLVAVSAANGIPPNTYDYQSARTRYTLSAEYSFSKRFSVYASLTDIGGLDATTRRYAPGTPEYARITRLQELGASAVFGVQGQY